MTQKPLTTETGAPVLDNQNSKTAGQRGPVLMEDVHLIEKLAHFNRERVPERVVHAKGAGAYGVFEVTHDVSKYTKARFLSEIGKQTEVFARFSTVAGEKGSADADRDPRGFAVKLYTEDGNYDVVGNNTPVFFIRDPLKFPDFIHTQKRHPATNVKDPNAVWDFFSLSPESLHQLIIVFSDRGTPKTHRHMHGFSSHTFQWVNAQGEAVWVKYHFRTDQGIENFTAAEAATMAGEDPDHATRDLYDAIEEGNAPSWSVYVQVMPMEDAESYRFDPFDVTKVWSHEDYPLIPVGRMTLNRNPKNYFAEVEQVAMSPGNIVPGIGYSPDKMLQGRLFAYADAHRYRIGTNFNLLPVNSPHATTAQNYQRDGSMRFDGNGEGSTNYEPNSQNGPEQTSSASGYMVPVSGVAGSASYTQDDHYTQPGNLYRLMSDNEKGRLVENIVQSLKQANETSQRRQLEHFTKMDQSFGDEVAKGLGLASSVNA